MASSIITLRQPRGIPRPFGRDQKRDIATASGTDLLESKVGQVLGTDGEMPWRPEAKSGLDRLRHHSNGQILQEVARYFVAEALAQQLPSVRVVDVSASREDRQIALAVKFYDASDPQRQVRTTQATVRLA